LTRSPPKVEKRIGAIRALLELYRSGQKPSAREAAAAQLVERELPWLIDQLRRSNALADEEE
jgi:hypothetical protein